MCTYTHALRYAYTHTPNHNSCYCKCVPWTGSISIVWPQPHTYYLRVCIPFYYFIIF